MRILAFAIFVLNFAAVLWQALAFKPEAVEKAEVGEPVRVKPGQRFHVHGLQPGSRVWYTDEDGIDHLIGTIPHPPAIATWSAGDIDLQPVLTLDDVACALVAFPLRW